MARWLLLVAELVGDEADVEEVGDLVRSLVRSE